MSPSELDAYLTVVRKHGGTSFRHGDVHVELKGAPAPEPQEKAPALEDEDPAARKAREEEALLFGHEAVG